MRCNIWGEPAENFVESVHRGDRVLAYGRLRQRSFDTKEGEKRTVVELEVDEIGPSTKFAKVKITKASRTKGKNDDGSAPANGAPGDDPWSSAPPAGTETPF